MKNNSRILKCATVALVAIVALTLVFSSCGKNKRANGNQQELALFDSLRIVAWDSRSMDILPVIDSLQEAGELSDLRADFLRGITYDRSRHIKVGESYYKKLYETVDPIKDGWPFYLEVANRLSQLRMTTGDNKGSIAVATEALDRAEKAGTLTDDNKSGFLWSIAACQDQLGMKEAEQTSLQVYELLEKLANERGMKVDRNLLVYSYNIAQRHLNNKNFDKAEEWVKRTESMLKEFTQPEDSAFVKEYAGAIAMARVYLLEGQDKGDLAYSFFRKSLPTIANTPEGIHLAASYLTEKGQYAEAANLYNHLDEILPADSKESEINLENIAWNIIPRLTANIKAGRTDTVISIARYIADNYVQSFIKDRESKATELATIYDTQGKERQIAEQQASMSKQRSVAMLIVLLLLTTFFIIRKSRI
jgi:hypothetical protein